MGSRLQHKVIVMSGMVMTMGVRDHPRSMACTGTEIIETIDARPSSATEHMDDRSSPIDDRSEPEHRREMLPRSRDCSCVAAASRLARSATADGDVALARYCELMSGTATYIHGALMSGVAT